MVMKINHMQIVPVRSTIDTYYGINYNFRKLNL
jgi:hypothetical protein